MSARITSRSNPRVQQLARERESAFFFEGEKLVADLLARRTSFDLLVHTPEWSIPPAALSQVSEEWIVSPAVMGKISSMKSPPEVLGVLRRIDRCIHWNQERIVLGLDSLQDPGNLGTIFRCASAFGIHALALSGACVTIRHPKLIRSAQTALLDVDFEVYPELDAVLGRAQEEGFHVYLTAPRPASVPVTPEQLELPAFLVFGGEGRGLPEPLLDRYPTVRIPQKAGVESLNVAIAACILMYEISTRGAP